MSKLRSKLRRLKQTYNVASDDDDDVTDGRPATSRTDVTTPRRASNPLRIDLSELNTTATGDVSVREGDVSRLQQENYVLKGQLDAERDLIESLQNELRVRDDMRTPTRSDDALTSSSKRKHAFVERETDLRLREHLQELRKLRTHLQESIERNGKLQDLLCQQLTEVGVDAGALLVVTSLTRLNVFYLVLFPSRRHQRLHPLADRRADGRLQR